MSESHAPVWIYGSGAVKLTFAPSSLPRTFTVDERAQPGPRLQLGGQGWHIVTVDVPSLVPGPNGKKVGLRLLSVTRTPKPAVP